MDKPTDTGDRYDKAISGALEREFTRFLGHEPTDSDWDELTHEFDDMAEIDDYFYRGTSFFKVASDPGGITLFRGPFLHKIKFIKFKGAAEADQ